MISILKRVFPILDDRECVRFIPLVLMMVAGGLLESLSIALVIPLIAGIMDSEQLTSGKMGDILRLFFGSRDGRGYLAILFVIMIVVFVCKNAFLVWRTYAQNKISMEIRERMQNRLLHYYLSRPYSFFLDAESGDILRTVTTDSDNFSLLVGNILGYFTSLIIVTIMAAFIFFVHPQITLLLAAILLVEYAIILKLFRPFLFEQGEKFRDSLGRGNGLVIEAVRGIKSIKVGGRESVFERQYAKAAHESSYARMVEQTLYAVPQRFIEAVTVSALLVYLLIELLAGGEISDLIPILSAFVLASSRILPCVSGISSSVSNAHYFEGSLEHVKAIDEALKYEERATPLKKEDVCVPATFDREISLDGITFAYPSENTPVLEKASLTIPRNSSVGIVGASGAGKTTLVDVLLGLLEPRAGTISMDGIQVDSTLPSWHAKFAYIPQDVFMLTGTIRDNVVFGREELGNVDDAHVWEALETAQLAGFVHTLKDGLDTEIGEAGIRLSGGQVQRLGIARAIYADAPILVFDEATSALDNETEASLMEAIDAIRGMKTLVIIAHRLTTIENCDIIYRVENGCVVQVDGAIGKRP